MAVIRCSRKWDGRISCSALGSVLCAIGSEVSRSSYVLETVASAGMFCIRMVCRAKSANKAMHPIRTRWRVGWIRESVGGCSWVIFGVRRRKNSIRMAVMNQRFRFLAPRARGAVTLIVFGALWVGVRPEDLFQQIAESGFPTVAREVMRNATANKTARVNPRGRLSWFCIHASFSAPWVARPWSLCGRRRTRVISTNGRARRVSFACA